MLSAIYEKSCIFNSYVECSYAECSYDKCRYVVSPSADCRGACVFKISTDACFPGIQIENYFLRVG